jgi:septum formation protein
LRSGDPDVVVIENARRKAHAGRTAAGGAGLALGVDTDVALDRRLLGKPEDEDGARARLETLSGRTHEVLGGVVLLDTAIGSEIPVERSAIARTAVTFNDLDRATIDLYVASGEWRDRAGGYAIQGLGSLLVAGLQGDFSNVVGLPVALVLQLAPNLIGRPKAKAKI